MLVKKIVTGCAWLVFLSLSLGLSCSLSASKDNNKPLGILYQDSFLDWRDNASDPGFNTQIKKNGNKLVISTTDADYGKAMSPFDPMTFVVTDKTELVVKVNQIDKNSNASFRIVKAHEPYETFELFKINSLTSQPGEFKAKLQSITGWKDETDMWFEIWLEGKNAKLVFEDIFFSDEDLAKQQQKKISMKAYTEKKFKSIPAGNLFYEDFRKGLNGWRTEESDPGFGSELNFEGEAPRLKIAAGKKFGKFMSPMEPIKVTVTRNTQLEISLGDMGTSKVKVEVMTAHAPYDAYTLIPDITKPGIYVVNLSEKTNWKEANEFWIQIWVGSANDPDKEKGAEIKHLRVF